MPGPGFTNAAVFNQEIVAWGHTVALPEFSKIVRAVTLAGLRLLVKGSPVNTGRFRSNWQVGIAGDPIGTVPEGTSALATGGAKIAAHAATPFVPLVIGNNLPQLEPIDQGTYTPPNPENTPEANKRRAARRRRLNKRATRSIAAALGDPGAPLVSDGYSIKAPQGVIGPAVETLRGQFPFLVVIDE
jgi:hypothetical protein